MEPGTGGRMMSFGGSCVTVGSSMPDEPVSSHVENRSDKQQRGKCVRKACKRDASDGDYCGPHARAQRAYMKNYMAGRRAEWDDADRCTRCGATERRRGSKYCPACLIATGDPRIFAVNRHVENRSARVAKRLIPWADSPHNEGRLRMRGGKRGAPSACERDMRGLADIRRVLDRYALALDEAYSEETKAMNKIAREDAIKAAHSGLALAVRLGMEALVTYGYECPVLAEDFEPDGDGIDHGLAATAREIAKTGR